MSFRARLTIFFVLIVVVPMVAIGVLVFRLINDSEQGKAGARVTAPAAAAGSLYESEAASARTDAETLGRAVGSLRGKTLSVRFAALAMQAGLARATLSDGSTTLVDVGDRRAVAPGSAILRDPAGGRAMTVTVSELTASQYARELPSDVGVVVRQGPKVLTATIAVANAASLPPAGNITLHGTGYRAVSQTFTGFGSAPVTVTLMSALSATATSLGSSRAVAAVLIVAFLVLAFGFSLLVSRERVRLGEAIRRTGRTFASSLDRPALLELALKTAVDAVQGSGGRISVRASVDDPLAETGREGSLAGLEDVVHDAERAALTNGGVGEAHTAAISVAAVTLGPLELGERAHGVISVARRGRPFNDDDLEVLRSLGAEAALALENIQLHFQVRRQAVTDELTGLANHGRFQELLSAEIEQVRRYHHPIGLIMLDMDDFKAVNDSYGHPQGDAVLRHVAGVLQENSRDADSPARYGGEQLSLILPHTDLEGAHASAERIRTAVEGLRVARTDGRGVLRVTASLGVAASTDGDKDGLIADADGALYDARRAGKNRTVSAVARAADASGAG
jgi:diguanylate cyclase (GGDEF)-like protein